MDLPASLGPVLFEILNQLIDMLTSLHDQVTKRIAAEAQKEVKQDEEDSDEDSSSLEDDDEDDNNPEEEENKRAGSSQQPARSDSVHGDDSDNAEREEAEMDAENENSH